MAVHAPPATATHARRKSGLPRMYVHMCVCLLSDVACGYTSAVYAAAKRSRGHCELCALLSGDLAERFSGGDANAAHRFVVYRSRSGGRPVLWCLRGASPLLPVLHLQNLALLTSFQCPPTSQRLEEMLVLGFGARSVMMLLTAIDQLADQSTWGSHSGRVWFDLEAATQLSFDFSALA